MTKLRRNVHRFLFVKVGYIAMEKKESYGVMAVRIGASVEDC